MHTHEHRSFSPGKGFEDSLGDSCCGSHSYDLTVAEAPASLQQGQQRKGGEPIHSVCHQTEET